MKRSIFSDGEIESIEEENRYLLSECLSQEEYHDWCKTVLNEKRRGLEKALDVEMDGICIISMGSKKGDPTGYCYFDNLSEIFSIPRKNNREWFIDEGNLYCKEESLNGTRFYEYRRFRKDVSESRKEKALNELFLHRQTESLRKISSRLGVDAAKILGIRFVGEMEA